ncbi:MAG: hypothetical protein WBP38_03305 [Hyphomicrobium sp.]|nr:hypothetical protein [Hyphomicrobium sp.]
MSDVVRLPEYAPRATVMRAERLAVSTEVECAVRRFPQSIRREVRRLVKSSSRIADLATVFPGILFALASRRGNVPARLHATSLIESGAQLKVVARALELPMWLRRLPPEAFVSLPDSLPKSEAFGRRIASRLPVYNRESAFWLTAVLFAERACHEDFAIWLAGQPVFAVDGDAEKLIAVVAAYAWFSSHPETAAHKLIVVPWRQEIAFDTALCAAKSWFNRVRLVLQLPPGIITDPWLKPGASAGYSFDPLMDHPAILAEAQAMQNCADQYGERIVRDKCRLFSVKRNGSRVATLEVGPHQREIGVLAINQLKARHNMAASTEVWQAAYTWMASQQNLKRLPALTNNDRIFDQGAWRTLLQPYREARSDAPWLDRDATHLMFAGFDADLADLARRGGVSSWLFT